MVKFEFRDFWPDFDTRDNFIARSLARIAPEASQVSSGDRADVLFFSAFGNRHASFVGLKVQVLGENLRPDWDMTDFAIGFDRVPDGRFLRYPNWAWDIDSSILLSPSAESHGPRENFCAFIVSNPHNPVRNAMFEVLSRERFVHSSGEVLRNSPPPSQRLIPSWRESKIQYLRSFRFCICFENTAYPGYTTEKLVDALIAGCIPIYWGDPLVDCDFDTEAFVHVRHGDLLTDVAKRVIEIDDHPEQEQTIRSTVPLLRAAHDRINPSELDAFLESIFCSVGPTLPRWRRRAFGTRQRTALSRAVKRVVA